MAQTPGGSQIQLIFEVTAERVTHMLDHRMPLNVQNPKADGVGFERPRSLAKIRPFSRMTTQNPTQLAANTAATDQLTRAIGLAAKIATLPPEVAAALVELLCDESHSKQIP